MDNNAAYKLDIVPNGNLLIRLGTHLDVSSSNELFNSLLPDIARLKPTNLILDLAETMHLDDYGILLLKEVEEMIAAHHGQFNCINPSPDIKNRLEIAAKEEAERCQIEAVKKSPSIFIRFGEIVIREAFNIRYMISFLGSVVLAFGHVIRHPGSLRVEETVLQMEKSGVDAVPIVGLISFLLGLIMAFMSSIQLSQFGANIYVASLVALAMVSELGPIMTAIVVAGRSGSLFAAEIGTMQISEEVDALYVMGINPTQFLAVPRILACILVVPLLTLFSDFFAITGGMIVGMTLLELTPGTYLAQTWETITLFEVLWGMLKSVVFAVLISWAGCLRGFQVRGGADAVGQAATSAVVSAIFLIILFDSIFAVIRSSI